MMWKIKGLDYLEDLSGDYNEIEAGAVLALAFERSRSLFDFDNYISARDEEGNLFSGSQLLARLACG